MILRGDYALSSQMGYQDPGCDMILGIFDLHDRIMFYLIIVLVVVVWYLISGLMGKKYYNIAHGNLIEFLWT